MIFAIIIKGELGGILMNKIKEYLPLIIKGVSLLFVVLALIFMFALPGVVKETASQGMSVTTTMPMFGLVFGNGTLHGETSVIGMPISVDLHLQGGLSFFGLLSFLLLVAAIILFVLSFVLKDKARLFLLIAGGLLIVSGIFAFLIKTFGTDITASLMGETGSPTSFTETFRDTNLGVGAILFGIFNILAGGLLLVNELVLNKNK